MQIGVPREALAEETRVALVPESAKRLTSKGHAVVVEAGAGEDAGIGDDEYRKAGAQVAERGGALGADLVLVVNPIPEEEVARLRQGSALLGLLRPVAHAELMRALAQRRISALSFDGVPRITRAQAMDVLSSMATVAGYRAALIGAGHCPRFFPMLMTAAGTVTPATVLVIGAGVAGLQAIATAHRLGAVVQSYDLRPAVKEQVESLGARFVELKGSDIGGGETEGGYAKEQTAEQQERQRQLLADTIAAAHVVITTAQVPGRPAPRIIDSATVARMRPGSVIVDIAAESGGNCELTRPGEVTRTEGGVTIAGPLNLPATMALPSSQMYSRNAEALLGELAPEKDLNLDLSNEICAGVLVTHDGEVLHADTRETLGLGAVAGETT